MAENLAMPGCLVAIAGIELLTLWLTPDAGLSGSIDRDCKAC